MQNYVVTLERSLERVLVLLDAMAKADSDNNVASSFFLSPAWARQYFSQWTASDFFSALVISKVESLRQDIPDAIVCVSHGRRSSRLSHSHRSLGFNEASRPGLESITVETNGLIGSSRLCFEEAIPLLLRELVALGGWDEIRINALAPQQAECFKVSAAACGLQTYVYSEQETYWIDFSDIRKHFGMDYLASRSANTRQQLRRATRSIQALHGKIKISRATTVEQGHEWLDALAGLHRKRWNINGSSQCFVSPQFCAFHHSLVDQMLDLEQLDILRVTAGEQTIGYLYNFFVAGRVYFNMGGIDYERFSAFHPGMLAHVEAIKYYQENGAQI